MNFSQMGNKVEVVDLEEPFFGGVARVKKKNSRKIRPKINELARVPSRSRSVKSIRR